MEGEKDGFTIDECHNASDNDNTQSQYFGYGQNAGNPGPQFDAVGVAGSTRHWRKQKTTATTKYGVLHLMSSYYACAWSRRYASI